MEEEWEDDEEYYEDDEECGGMGRLGEAEEVDPIGPKFAPVFTGVLTADGKPIIRHPIVMRMGFHLEEHKYHCPTKEDGPPIPGKDSVVGWYYEIG